MDIQYTFKTFWCWKIEMDKSTDILSGYVDSYLLVKFNTEVIHVDNWALRPGTQWWRLYALTPRPRMNHSTNKLAGNFYL